MRLGCVIMAAGESRRFGENKLLRCFDGVPLYARALSAVPKDVFAQVCVVTAYAPVLEQAEALGFQTVLNDRPDLGISRTICMGLEKLKDCDGVAFMTADQPLLTARTLENLAASFASEPACIWAAAHHGRRGNPCLFPRDLFAELFSLNGDVGGSRVIKAHPDRLRFLEIPEMELADCDTAEALWELKRKFER